MSKTTKMFKFIKMHGLGNDFILLDGIKKDLPRVNYSKFTIKICNRKAGVGADGLILMLPSKKHDFRMRIFNSDGSEAEMCGNGFRCLIRYLTDKRHTRKKTIDIQTIAGMISGEIVNSSDTKFLIRVAMGIPEFDCRKIPVTTKYKDFIKRYLKVETKYIKTTIVSIGNPHAVIFVPDLELDWKNLGEKIENHQMFPNRANVEFVQILNRKTIIIKSWERGAGPTMASGTGASAAVAAGIRSGYLDNKTEVKYDLGSLHIEQDKKSNIIYKTGPAEYSFEGSYKY